MNTTVTLETPHHPQLRVRVFATAAALVAIAGGTAAIVATRSDTTTKPTPAVTAAPAASSHDDPLVSRFGQQSVSDDHIYNGRR